MDACRALVEERMSHSFLIRYGLRAQVGKFSAERADFSRGETVVIRSHRGTELGEVLAPLSSPGDEAADACILRPAGPADLEQARRGAAERSARFELCQRLFQDGVWPLELVDVEPLLDDRRTVLHYLGPHRLDVTGLLAVFRSSYNLDVMLEPVGRDIPVEVDDAAEANDDGGGCGSGGCGSCSSAGSCGAHDGSARGGCSDCGVKKLLAKKPVQAAR